MLAGQSGMALLHPYLSFHYFPLTWFVFEYLNQFLYFLLPSGAYKFILIHSLHSTHYSSLSLFSPLYPYHTLPRRSPVLIHSFHLFHFHSGVAKVAYQPTSLLFSSINKIKKPSFCPHSADRCC